MIFTPSGRRVFKRGASPSYIKLPLSFQGEGDTGGEVIKYPGGRGGGIVTEKSGIRHIDKRVSNTYIIRSKNLTKRR